MFVISSLINTIKNRMKKIAIVCRSMQEFQKYIKENQIEYVHIPSIDRVRGQRFDQIIELGDRVDRFDEIVDYVVSGSTKRKWEIDIRPKVIASDHEIQHFGDVPQKDENGYFTSSGVQVRLSNQLHAEIYTWTPNQKSMDVITRTFDSVDHAVETINLLIGNSKKS